MSLSSMIFSPYLTVVQKLFFKVFYFPLKSQMAHPTYIDDLQVWLQPPTG